MVDRQGGVRLIDFGASKQLDAQTGGATAKTRQTYTNGYAPREQMDENFSLYGAWTDIYSLGATLYCLLTKHRPPMPSDIDDDHSADKHEALPFPATVSEQMRSLVRRMMNTSRQKRPQNVDEVMAMLGISAGNAYGGGTQSQYDEATAFASQSNDEATSFASQSEGDATQMAQGQTAQGPSNEQTRFSGNGGSNRHARPAVPATRARYIRSRAVIPATIAVTRIAADLATIAIKALPPQAISWLLLFPVLPYCLVFSSLYGLRIMRTEWSMGRRRLTIV